MIKKLLSLPVWGLVLISLAIIAVIMVVFSSLNPWNPMNYFARPETVINTDRAEIIKEIQSLNRLETASYTMEKIIEAGDEGNLFQDLVYGDRLLLIAHGQVVAGVDLSQVSDQDLKINGSSLQIRLPDTQIFSTQLDNTQTKVYDRQQGLLSGGNKDLESQARQSAEKSISQAACQGGILQEAATQAKTQVAQLFSLAGFTQVEVQVAAGQCLE